MSDSRKVMIIDASPLIRSSARRMIRSAFPGIGVLEADSAASAMRLFRQWRPVMVITDIHLRKSSGLALAEKIASCASETTIVIFTNEDGREYRKEALERGADFFFSKSEPSGGAILEILKHRLKEAPAGRP